MQSDSDSNPLGSIASCPLDISGSWACIPARALSMPFWCRWIDSICLDIDRHWRRRSLGNRTHLVRYRMWLRWELVLAKMRGRLVKGVRHRFGLFWISGRWRGMMGTHLRKLERVLGPALRRLLLPTFCWISGLLLLASYEVPGSLVFCFWCRTVYVRALFHFRWIHCAAFLIPFFNSFWIPDMVLPFFWVLAFGSFCFSIFVIVIYDVPFWASSFFLPFFSLFSHTSSLFASNQINWLRWCLSFLEFDEILSICFAPEVSIDPSPFYPD